jgi:hypothetical protein
MKNAQDEDFASDVLYGAKAIARFLFGTEAEAMKVYRLGEALPLFKLNGVICGRKSRLTAQIKASEKEHALRRRRGTFAA